jgi:ketose-bisphosphate aldolase
MSLRTTSELFRDAEKSGYAVGCFDTCGGKVDVIEAIFRAAEELRSPVIVSDVYRAVDGYWGLENFARMVTMRAEKSSIPVALHLDHATDFCHVVRAIRCGFTSVMYDGSSLPYEENVETTKRVIDVAHAVGVTVESQCDSSGASGGHGLSHSEASFTDPDVAEDFVSRTGVDSFAPAIGNVHGFTSKAPALDFPRLKTIRDRVGVPLVLHGSTGIPPGDLRRVIELGVRKINLGTLVCHTFTEGIKCHVEHKSKDGRSFFLEAREQVKLLIMEQIRVYGSSG